MRYYYDGKMVGTATKRGVFTKTVQRKKHLFKAIPAYAIQCEVFDRLVEDGIERIIIRESDTGYQYDVAIDVWVEKGIEMDKGFGLQRFLPLNYMTHDGP